MTAFADARAADLRLNVLGILAEAAREDGPDTLNAAILQSAVREFGHRPTRADTVAVLDWLAARGLVRLLDSRAGIPAAALTARGEDVARGRTRVDGVRRPPLDDPLRADADADA